MTPEDIRVLAKDVSAEIVDGIKRHKYTYDDMQRVIAHAMQRFARMGNEPEPPEQKKALVMHA